MNERWLRVGILTGVIFAINTVARLVVRIGGIEDPDTQGQISLYAFVAIGVAMATVAILWARLRPLGDVVTDLVGAGTAAALLILLIGPYIGGSTPAAEGLDIFLIQAGLYAGFAGGGAVFGLFVLTMLGRDYKSVSLERFAESKMARPHRVVRR